jgi:hypothetical protein
MMRDCYAGLMLENNFKAGFGIAFFAGEFVVKNPNDGLPVDLFLESSSK